MTPTPRTGSARCWSARWPRRSPARTGAASPSCASAGIVQLCGFRTETCPRGMKTGDAISPPGGYVGGGLQLQVDVGIGPAGDVWVTNNWQDHASCFGKPDETVSTRCAGDGVVVFFGLAKP